MIEDDTINKNELVAHYFLKLSRDHSFGRALYLLDACLYLDSQAVVFNKKFFLKVYLLRVFASKYTEMMPNTLSTTSYSCL